MPVAVRAFQEPAPSGQEQVRQDEVDDLLAEIMAEPDVVPQADPPRHVPQQVRDQQPLAIEDVTHTLEEQRQLAQKRGMLLDDVPHTIKKSKVGADQLPDLVMFLVQGAPQDLWLTQGELDGLGRLLGYRVVGARVHRRPRRRPFGHAHHTKARRLTLLCTDADQIEALDEGAGLARSTERRPVFWTGMTIFYEQRPGYDDRDQLSYVDTPMGLIPLRTTAEDRENLEYIFMSWGGETLKETLEVYLLKLKNNQKELDPKAFDQKEKEAFDQSDAAEWKQLLASGSVAVVPASEGSSIPRELIFTAPMRFVRTNKSKEPDQLQAKSRLIIPGHRDPQLGLYRTVYVRGPADGLPSVNGSPALRPYQLLQLLKGMT
jgi:hypothetical protein